MCAFSSNGAIKKGIFFLQEAKLPPSRDNFVSVRVIKDLRDLQMNNPGLCLGLLLAVTEAFCSKQNLFPKLISASLGVWLSRSRRKRPRFTFCFLPAGFAYLGFASLRSTSEAYLLTKHGC